MPRLRVNVPLWLPQRSRAAGVRFPRLGQDLSVDVAIVGAGITGAAVAWKFAQAGVRVAVVDAGSVARGSTAASTALLMQEPDEDFCRLAQRYGKRQTRRIWQLSRNATADFVRTLRALEIRCDLVARDSIYYAPTDEDARQLRTELRRRHAADIGGRWLNREGLRHAAGIDGAGAIRTSGDAQADPFAACIGLLGAAADRGARIFEKTPVTSIKASRDGVALRTARAVLHADRVVIATGYATPYFKPLLRHFRMLNTYVLATRRLSASERCRIGLGAVMLWDTGRPYHYARWTPDHRLMLGGGDRPLLPERKRADALRAGARGVYDHFLSLYPALAGVPIEWQWEGLFATTPDALPCIGPHQRYPRHLFALGYGGNGMTFGFMAARLLLEQYRGARSADHELFAFSR